MIFPYKFQTQPYISWKGHSTNSVVPGNSRGGVNGYSDNAQDFIGPSFKARPIKHYRRKLTPNPNSGKSKASIRNMIDTPGNMIYLGNKSCCDPNNKGSIATTNLIPTEKYNKMYIHTEDKYFDSKCANISEWQSCNAQDRPVCVSCNPENNIIKSAVSLLNKKYYTGTKSYLQSRGKLYEQKASIQKKPGIEYVDDDGQMLWPTDDSDGPQNFNINNCSTKNCPAKNCNCVCKCVCPEVCISVQSYDPTQYASLTSNPWYGTAPHTLPSDWSEECMEALSKQYENIYFIYYINTASETYFYLNGTSDKSSSSLNTGSSVALGEVTGCCGCYQEKVTTIYKPSNRKFAVQGAVSSSNRLLRLKVDTITKNGSSFRSAYGDAAANAGRYRASQNSPYFIKTKSEVCISDKRKHSTYQKGSNLLFSRSAGNKKIWSACSSDNNDLNPCCEK